MNSKHTSHKHPTIIKRSARKNHSGSHGGAWKVAFADFTLAMMALFMVLWIMGAASEEERQEIVAMFYADNLFNIMKTGSQAWDGGSIPLMDTRAAPTVIMPPVVSQATVQAAPQTQPTGNGSPANEPRREMEELARIIMRITSAYHAQPNMHIEILPQGLRILISDDKQREMFPRSSAALAPFFRKLLEEFAPVLGQIDNKIMITGHTDAASYREQGRYNNWNLSGDRAMQARNVLIQAGLDERRVLQVSAMADQMLLYPNDPLNAANRRIEIMVLTQSASDALAQFFGHHGENVTGPLIEKLTHNDTFSDSPSR